MRKLVLAVLVGLTLSGCATQGGYNGAAVGGATGAIGGAILDRNNGWRGAVVGGTLGAIFGGVLGEQNEINARDAYEQGRIDERRDHHRRHQPRYEEPRRHYHERCGCWGYIGRDGRFYPSR